MAQSWRPHWMITAVLLAGAFAFRVLYGLSLPFWYEDERQVYLIGLRSFARGEWPYFGADVVWTGGQLPGALQAMLIRWPLSVWSVPEAPIIFLGGLSFAALALFAWYLSRRLPDVPRWIIWSGLLTLPWTLNFSTHIINTSYILPASVMFFVGLFEGMPALRRGIVPFALAWALMGAGLFFVLQIHMSWVLLPPYVLVAVINVLANRADSLGMTSKQAAARAAAGFLIGAAITGGLLAPTIARHGLNAGYMFGVVQFQPQSPMGLLTTAARVLSFASFETNRFLGFSTADRVMLLWRQPWIVPFTLVVAAAGVIQPIWMAVTAFRRAPQDAADWRRVRTLVAGTIALVYVDYFLSVRGPQAHAFYVVFPVSALFAATCWQVCARAAADRWRRWSRVAGVVIASGVVMHAGLAIDRWSRLSLYADRDLAAAAITQRNDRLLGDRRDTRMETQDHRPRPMDRVEDEGAFLAAKPEDDLQIVASTWTTGTLGVSRFSVTIANRSRVAAWLDVRYATAYLGAQGQLIAAREGVIKRVLEPGDTRVWPDITDDFVPPGATAATLTIIGAERCIPATR